jgi:hypothetical protein
MLAALWGILADDIGCQHHAPQQTIPASIIGDLSRNVKKCKNVEEGPS